MDDAWAAEISKIVKRQNEAMLLLAGVIDELGGGAWAGIDEAYSILTKIEKELEL